MSIKFFKLHGSGNDILILDNLENALSSIEVDLPEVSQRILNRRYGIGADQIMWLEKSARSDLRARIFNPDGSEAETCGNGLLCVARYIWECKEIFKRKNPLLIEVRAREVRALGSADAPAIEMGQPLWRSPDLPEASNEGVCTISVAGNPYQCSVVAIPNPHCVVFVSDLDTIELDKLGPLFERDKNFPRRTNVEFVQILSRQRVRVKVWERGAGATLSCGSASSALVSAGIKRGLLDQQVTVEMPGGEHIVVVDPQNEHITLSGKASWIATGHLLLEK